MRHERYQVVSWYKLKRVLMWKAADNCYCVIKLVVSNAGISEIEKIEVEKG